MTTPANPDDLITPRGVEAVSPSGELAVVTTVVCVPIAVLGVFVVGQPAILGAGIVAVLL